MRVSLVPSVNKRFFCRCFTGNGIVEFILYSGIKMICGIGISIIINAALGKYISYLLPYSAFAGTDGANSFQQFTEIVFSKSCFTLFQAFVIHSKALYHIFFQNSGCPYTESGCLNGVNSVTNGNNSIQIVIIGRGKLRFSGNSTVWSGYFHFGNYHLRASSAYSRGVSCASL